MLKKLIFNQRWLPILHRLPNKWSMRRRIHPHISYGRGKIKNLYILYKHTYIILYINFHLK